MVFATSTPKMINGNVNDNSYNGGNNNLTIVNEDNNDKMKLSEKEKFMNSINANASTNGHTTTVIADIEGEVKKRNKHLSDKTYYIAKEILMTELTYKKDLDVINVVSYTRIYRLTINFYVYEVVNPYKSL